MFEKLFLLIKNNAGPAVINNPDVPQKFHDAVINEASSTIIEVLKSQIETGKMKDLVSFFQFSGIYNNSLVKIMVNRFTNKLVKFYGIEANTALSVANSLIPPVMQELVKQSKNERNKEFLLTNLLSKLNANRADLTMLVNIMMAA